MTEIDTSTLQSLQQIRQAEQKAGRKLGSSLLVGASKTQNAATVRQFHISGLQHFGENYLNEALDKITALNGLNITWHYIGGIQSNKTKAIAENFDWVHTIDRLKIAERLSRHLSDYQQSYGSHNSDNDHDKGKVLNVLIQVNLDGEQSKNGIPPHDVQALAKELITLPHLKLRGLMSIPKARDNYQHQLDCHLRLAELKKQLNDKLNLELDTLSAGMSKDLEAAITAGSTMIRIGTDLFGKRQ